MVEYTLTVPACVLQCRGEIPVSAPRRIAVERRQAPDPVGCFTETPKALVAIDGPLGASRRLQLLGGSLLSALEQTKPLFHRSVVGGKVLMTDGTTIYITGRTRDHDGKDSETIVATWDYGETALDAMKRLNRVRRLLADVPDNVAYRFMMLQEWPDLSPPQALLSDVITAKERFPQTSLAGCGAAAQIAVAVGNDYMDWKFDHRLFDPVHMNQLIDPFYACLKEQL